jgi:hypothetical protein
MPSRGERSAQEARCTASTVKYVYVNVCVSDLFGETCATSARKYNPNA